MLRRLRWLYVSALLLLITITITAHGGSKTNDNKQTWPEPAAGSTFFTQGYDLPRTQSAQQLSANMASEHLEYGLDGWFFFGSQGR